MSRADSTKNKKKIRGKNEGPSSRLKLDYKSEKLIQFKKILRRLKKNKFARAATHDGAN